MYALTNAKIFTNNRFITDHAVIVDNKMITSIVSNSNLPQDIAIHDLEGKYLVPGFIDLQVNGGAGHYFTRTQTSETLEIMCKAHLKYGTTSSLPTLTTTRFDDILHGIKVLSENIGKHGILGLHLEGPFLHPDKRGAHREKYLLTPTDEHIKAICEVGKDVISLITIAPELFTTAQIQQLLAANMKISAGHSTMTYEEAISSFEQGISKVTHLYNAMTGLHHRSPGIVGAALDSEVWAAIIVDGHHVHYSAVRLAYQLKKERLFLISDASFVDAPTDDFSFDGFNIHLENGCFVNEEGRLAGANIAMLHAVQNCVKYVGIPLEDTIKMATLYPAQYLDKDDIIGKIDANYLANMVVLNEDLALQQVIFEGDFI